MAEESKILKKPNLANLHMNTIIRNVFVAFTLAGLSGAIYKIGFFNPKKYKYEVYYKHQDAEKTFERMRKAGVFQSCPKE